jgi:hypothetical protein
VTEITDPHVNRRRLLAGGIATASRAPRCSPTGSSRAGWAAGRRACPGPCRWPT